MWRDVPPAWTKADGPEADIVVSTRARLARNLSGMPFPGRAAAEDLENIAEMARQASGRLRNRYPDLCAIKVAEIEEEDRTFLVDAHLASPQQVRPRSGGMVFLEPGGRIAIMVNEEDHLRIQAILPGLQPIPAWQLVDEIDDVLSVDLKFACSKRLGYLTASLSNVGTGLRISAMMHLAGLAMVGRLARTLQAAIDLGVSVRGLFGEGSKGLGDLYQVSNEVTLGVPERELAERVKGVSNHLLGEERRAREEILSERPMDLVMAARQNLAKLRSAETVSPNEALKLLSPIRFAAAAGMVKGCGSKDLNELMVAMRLIRVEEPGRYTSIIADRRRAVLVRRRLRGTDI
ncbi:MAG TPA: ATP--guanido phosphotransferase [Armatimonadota bacterium]|nr:ATP--guanido phosphotransferase [Armatimonadota bacterium]